MSLQMRIILGALLGWLVFGFTPSEAASEDSTTPQRRRSVPPRAGAAFLKQVRSYEETQYVARAVLRNGATVIVNETRNDPVVAILLRVESGDFHGPEDPRGALRLLERMFYRSSSSRSAGIVAKELRALGGILHSEQQRDHTLFWTVVPSPQWKKALELQLGALTEPRYEEPDIRREVDLMLGEVRRGVSDPHAQALARLKEMTFASDGVGDSAEQSLRDLSLPNLLEMRGRLYSPERVRLIVTGDITTPEVLDEVVKLYAKPPDRTEKPARPAQGPGSAGMRFSQVRSPSDSPLVSLGFSTPSLRSEDYPAMQVLFHILARGQGSVMARRLQDRKVIRRFQAGLETSMDRGLLYVHMAVDTPNLDKCEIALFTELELLKLAEPDQVEMTRALASLEREYWERLQLVEGRAEALAHFESLGGWKRMDEYLSVLRKVSPADVKRVAARFLTLDNCSLLETSPPTTEVRSLSAEAFRKTIEELLPASAGQEQESRERATELRLDLPTSPGTFQFSEVRHPMRKSSIFRGPDLFVREDHTSPLIHVGVFYPGGALHETEENAGITDLMLRWMLRGSGGLSREQIYRQLELYGARVQPVVEEDYFGVLFTALSRDTENGLDLLFRMVKSPKLDPDELEKVKEGLSRPRDGSGTGRVKGTLKRLLFGGFPYALDFRGSTDNLSRLGPDLVLAWHKERVMNKKPLVVIVGDTEGTSLARYFVRNFSGSRFEDAKVPETFAEPIEQRTVAEESWDLNESVVGVAFQAPPAWDEDSYGMKVIESYLKGIGGLLSDELRYRSGLAHEVAVWYEPLLRGGSVVLSVATDPQNEAKALEQLEGLIRGLAETPINYRDYRTALIGAAGEHRIRMQAAEYQITSLVRTQLAGRGMEALDEYPARLEGVRDTELGPIAARVLNLDKAGVIRVHGRSVSGSAEELRK